MFLEEILPWSHNPKRLDDSSNCCFTFGYFFRPELYSIFRFLQATKPEFYAKVFQLFNVEEKEEIDEILDFLSTRDSYQKVLIISTNADSFRFIKKSKHLKSFNLYILL